MHVPFSEVPGRHERRLRRGVDCRLVPRPLAQLEDHVHLEAQRRDHDELIAFVRDLRNTVGRAVAMEASAAREPVLGPTEDLERLDVRSTAPPRH